MQADVTLYLTKVADARAYGCVELSAENRVKSFLEKMEKPPSNSINAGCYIFNRSIIDEIPAQKVVSVERESFPQLLAADKKVFGFIDQSYWLDIGTPAALVSASKDLISGKVFSAATPEHSGDTLISADAVVAADCTISDGTIIYPKVVVESATVISGSIIGEGAQIGSDCIITDSFIAPNTKIKAGSIILNNYLGF